MQEDRKKNPKKRGPYSKVDFDIDFGKICKKMKRKHEKSKQKATPSCNLKSRANKNKKKNDSAAT